MYPRASFNMSINIYILYEYVQYNFNEILSEACNKGTCKKI